MSLNWRISVGIGRPPGKMDPVNFVLRPFTKQELEEVCWVSDATSGETYV